MYPAAELTELAARKSRLRRAIAVSRLQCVAAAAEIARPIGVADHLVAQWHKISPFAKIAAVPLGFVLRRRLMPLRRTGLLGQALKWMPTVLGAARVFSARRGRG
jgi:hypothetical protein